MSFDAERQPAVRFRAIEEGDFAAVRDLIPSEEELFLFYAQATYPFTVEQVRKLVRIRMEPTTLLYGERVAGFANFYGYKEGRSVFIGNVVVDPALRGRGLGRRLVGHMVDLAFAKYALPRVRIHVYHRNLPALLLYQSLGFKPHTMKPKRDYKGDPVMLLALGLRRDAWTGLPRDPAPSV